MARNSLTPQTENALAWDDLRTSPAFPAIVGGLAGAAGGVALMFLLSRRGKPKQTLPAAYDTQGNPMNVVYLPAPEQFRILGFTVGDLLTLATVGFSLFRQIQTLAQENELKQDALAWQPDSVAAPAPLAQKNTRGT